MELPTVGQQCSEDSCRRLDFLPVKCDACNKTFCSGHYTYDKHSCPLAYRKNVQVPVCPLCNTPVPGKADELPDIRVSRHIDSYCQSDKAVTRRKVYTNKCSQKGCKQKELIPIKCDKCALNFCLKHRHPQDHTCAQINSKSMSKAAAAALARKTSSPNAVVKPKTASTASVASRGFAIPSMNDRAQIYSQATIQGNLSEDAALRLALQASMSEAVDVNGTPRPTAALSQEQEDFMLAQAIAESEREAGGVTRQRRSQNSCKIS